MPFEYPASVRRGLSERMRQGEAVLAVHAESGICLGTLYRWKHQALVDAGLASGTPSTLAPDLQSAAKRIRQLEDELAIVKAASALYDGQVVVPPKGSSRSSMGSSPRASQPEVPAAPSP